MSAIFFKKDLSENLKSWLICTLILIVLFVSMYFTATLMKGNSGAGGIIISQLYTMFINLIPLIYLVMAGKKMIVKKVDDGSFYLDMISGYKRKTIILTKMIYYFTSLLAMYLLLTLSGIICCLCKEVNGLALKDVLYLNLMSFLLNLSLSSIIFCSSCYFNTNANASLLSTGIPVLSYAFNTISGMFVNIPGLSDNTFVKLLTKLKYLSFHSLFSYDEIIGRTNFNYIGIVIFISVSIVFYILSYYIFKNKDLPL